MRDICSKTWQCHDIWESWIPRRYWRYYHKYCEYYPKQLNYHRFPDQFILRCLFLTIPNASGSLAIFFMISSRPLWLVLLLTFKNRFSKFSMSSAENEKSYEKKYITWCAETTMGSVIMDDPCVLDDTKQCNYILCIFIDRSIHIHRWLCLWTVQENKIKWLQPNSQNRTLRIHEGFMYPEEFVKLPIMPRKNTHYACCPEHQCFNRQHCEFCYCEHV